MRINAVARSSTSNVLSVDVLEAATSPMPASLGSQLGVGRRRDCCDRRVAHEPERHVDDVDAEVDQDPPPDSSGLVNQLPMPGMPARRIQKALA